MNKPIEDVIVETVINAEAKAQVAARKASLEARSLDLATHVNCDGDVMVFLDQTPERSRMSVNYGVGSAFVGLRGIFTAKQLRFLADHIERHRKFDPGY